MTATDGLLTDFWSSAVPPRGMDQQLNDFRAMIVANQLPLECTTTCIIKPTVHVGGAMQNHRRVAMALLQAVVGGCTLVGGWPRWRNSPLNTGAMLRKLCSELNRTSDECYFLPVSNCSKGKPGRTLISNYDTSEALEKVARRTGLRSEVLVMGTLLSWVMRPQKELQAALVHYGNTLGLRRDGVRHRRIAMHLRRGDKYSLHPKHMRNHSWRIHPLSFAVWGRRVSSIIGAERVLYMTDDEAINMTILGGPLFRLAPAPRSCAPSGVDGQLQGVFGNHMKRTAAQSLSKLIAHPEVWEKRDPRLHTTECGSEMWADDGILFYTGVLLLAQCAAFIGLQISNVGMAVTELMSTQHFPPLAYDVLNDVYRGPFLSDERLWVNGVHNPNSLRPLAHDRLANGDGTSSHGCWSCTGVAAVLPPDWDGKEAPRGKGEAPGYDSASQAWPKV